MSGVKGRSGLKPRPLIVAIKNGCWEITSHKVNTHNGYVSLRGVRAHRWSYEQNVGPVPKGLDICHKCDNPICINPAHLFLGTRQENMQDAANKGRLGKAKGEDQGAAKLKIKDIPEIFALQRQGKTHRAIALIYDVSHTTIGEVLRKKRWRHI